MTEGDQLIDGLKFPFLHDMEGQVKELVDFADHQSHFFGLAFIEGFMLVLEVFPEGIDQKMKGVGDFALVIDDLNEEIAGIDVDPFHFGDGLDDFILLFFR